jgi:hypothetical protein
MKTIKVEDVANINITSANGVYIIITLTNGHEYKANGEIVKIENTLYCYHGFEIWSN